jgi:hypothetical protein
MILCLFALPDNISEETQLEIATAIANVLKHDVTLKTMTESELISSTKKIRKDLPTEFMKIIDHLITILGDPTESSAFAGKFWNEVLIHRNISMPILQILAMGPKSNRELNYLQKNKCEFLVSLAAAAITVCNG